ncbi:helix-turn-helix transcriptional regulator [Gordonia neofelifaecis]|uniref:Putative transcriptional regulator n=1 Tax=Gordonia neofelifaecis NRRL B-59395 TaxID=644548 RepID=F1YGF6_9ACTN|nr:helix-turn-helix transcriptional regulator [Gordonia neofelifaecis]EGD56103.1 putative transcriptional regulator [Gordonia neofelifaecis NRRL B-59395]
MMSGLTAERACADVDVLSRAGLGLDDFISEAITAVGRAVPWSGACVGTIDPETLIITSAREYGALEPDAENDALFGAIEYGMDERTSFRQLALGNRSSAAMHAEQWLDTSPRWDRLMRPVYGFGDEARSICRDGSRTWGCAAYFREAGDRPFSPEEVDFLERAASSVARGLRVGMMTRLADMPIDADRVSGPAVVVFDACDEVSHISLGARERLEALASVPNTSDPMSVLTMLVSAARRMRADGSVQVPRIRMRTPAGMWLVLHASPLDGIDGTPGGVVLTIEEARPPEIVELVVAAFGLTLRERDVTRLVLQGLDTKEIATRLHLSAYTVQDHLKSVFEKAGVRSRRDLISRVYFDQYVPRLGAQVGPSGAFLDARSVE